MAHIQPTVSGFKNRKSFSFFFFLAQFWLVGVRAACRFLVRRKTMQNPLCLPLPFFFFLESATKLLKI